MLVYPPHAIVVRDPYGTDVGLFGVGRAISRVGRAVGRTVRGAVRGVTRFTRGAIRSARQTALRRLRAIQAAGRKTTRAVKRTARAAARTAKRVARKAAPALEIAATGASFIPGVGTGVAAGLGAAAAAARGRSLAEIAKSAALSAAPGGALTRAAIEAGYQVARGKPVEAALAAGAREAIPTAAGKAAFDVVKAAAEGKRVDRAVLAAAERQLAQQIPKAVPAVRGPAMFRKFARPLTSPRVLKMLPRRISPTVFPSGRGAALAAAALRRRPTLGALGAAAAARRLGLPTRHVIDARARMPGPLRWTGLPRRVSRMVRRFSPFSGRFLSRGDVMGISADGRTYTVEPGDYGVRIAQKLVGDGNRWRELKAANPEVAKRPDPQRYGLVIYPGDVLRLPESWWPEVAAEELAAAVVLQSKAILATWSKTAGAAEAGVADYGLRTEDATADWTERDRLMLASFSRWRGKGLSTDGDLTQAHVDELQAWAAEQAALPAPAPAIIPGLPAPPIVLPELVVTPEGPEDFIPPDMSAPPAVMPPTPVVLPTPPDIPIISPRPADGLLPKPPEQVIAEREARPPVLPVAAPPRKKDDGTAVAAAIGAALMFLL
jgi:hypothetical protein